MPKAILLSNTGSDDLLVFTCVSILIILLCVLLVVLILDRKMNALTEKVDKLAKRAKKNSKLAKMGVRPAPRLETRDTPARRIDTSPLEH